MAVGQLEDNAAKRKERLLALKRKLGGGGQEEGGEGEELLPTPVFRSYRPEAEELAGQGGRGSNHQSPGGKTSSPCSKDGGGPAIFHTSILINVCVCVTESKCAL